MSRAGSGGVSAVPLNETPLPTLPSPSPTLAPPHHPPCPLLCTCCLQEAVKDANVLIFCAPHQFIGGIVKQLAGKVDKQAIAVSLTKVGKGAWKDGGQGEGLGMARQEQEGILAVLAAWASDSMKPECSHAAQAP